MRKILRSWKLFVFSFEFGLGSDKKYLNWLDVLTMNVMMFEDRGNSFYFEVDSVTIIAFGEACETALVNRLFNR